MTDTYNKKIVIIEDSKILLKMICVALKGEGFTNLLDYSDSVQAFQDIAEDQLSESTIDLVITDLNMPDLDGVTLISRLKEDENTRDLKIMVLTGEGDEKIRDEVMNLGVIDYIVKPFEKEDFASRIFRALEL